MFIAWMSRRHSLTAAFLAVGLATSAPAAVQVPSGFQAIDISPALTSPVAMAFAPDGRIFVAEKAGIVKVIQNNQVVSTFIDLTAEVNARLDRGMLGLALDPNFLVNRLVYLLYVVDPILGEPDESGTAGTFSRLTRYAGTAASNGNTADAASRTVLIGPTPSQGIPQCWSSHATGALRFAADGSLMVSHGDSAQFAPADAGGITPTCFQPPLFSNAENIGAFRAQMLDSMDGKIMRIDPNTGNGRPGNPHFSAAKPDSPGSRVWVSGLRNPFRFCIRPGTGSPTHPGTLYVGDVGWNSFEEITAVTNGGDNLGWPCREGFSTTEDYPDFDLPQWDCASIGSPANPGALKAPVLAYHHFDAMQSMPPGYTGVCVVSGAFHTGNNYPSPFRNGFFFADHVTGWIKALRVNGNNQATGIFQFGSTPDRIVDFAVDPFTGELCVVSMNSGRIVRLHSLIGPGDVNRDGDVDVDDLLLVITQWGACSNPLTCPADLDVSGAVEVNDLLEVIVNWG